MMFFVTSQFQSLDRMFTELPEGTSGVGKIFIGLQVSPRRLNETSQVTKQKLDYSLERRMKGIANQKKN